VSARRVAMASSYSPPEGKMMITRLHVCPAEEEDSAIDLDDDDDDDWWSR
jgi:hypothetical protein